MFNECVDAFLEGLRPHADGKTEVSMKEAFHEAALDVISKVWRLSQQLLNLKLQFYLECWSSYVHHWQSLLKEIYCIFDVGQCIIYAVN